MGFKDLIYNRKILLVLLVLNFIGTVFAFFTYISYIKFYLDIGQYYLVPIFMVSFWLYLFAFIFVLYLYFKLRIPRFLGSLIFIYCFVYGFGSFIFYPLFMAFVRGITIYHLWNIVAHGFVGLQALLFLYVLEKPRIIQLSAIALIFFVKDLFDWFGSGFLYFLNFQFPYTLKIVLALIAIGLQVAAFYLLLNKTKRLK